jgi:DNA repair exonuclease SbcCD ATPase subunit
LTVQHFNSEKMDNSEITELRKYIINKREALKFWTSLRKVMKVDNKIKLLQEEITITITIIKIKILEGVKIKMKINNIKLSNFKGIKEFELDCSNSNLVDIFGDNATGKTSVFDSFMWLLFDKDSNNSQKFNIKPLDSQNNVIRGLCPEVEISFDIDGETLVLKKVYYEKFEKQKGSSKSEYTGNSTDYFINEVPVKKTDYDKKIGSIIDEKVFKMLTSPNYFNQVLHWTEKREVLMKIAGEVSNDEVIATDKNLSSLTQILSNVTIEDRKKVIAAKRKKINDELAKIPVRINEINNLLPDINGLKFYGITEQIQDLQAKKNIQEQTIVRIENGGEIAQKEKEIAEIETELMSQKIESDKRLNTEIGELYVHQQNTNLDISSLKSSISNKNSQINMKKSEIEMLNKKSSDLRKEWASVNDKTFEITLEEVCPTCKQSIPTEQLEEVREKAQQKFNLEKSEKLAAITLEGKQIVAKTKNIESEVKKLEEECSELKESEVNKIEELATVTTSITTIKDNYKDNIYEERKKYFHDKKSGIRTQIDNCISNLSSEIEKCKTAIKTLDAEITTLQETLSKKEQFDKSNERIQELYKEEKALVGEVEGLDKESDLLESFIRTKVNLMENKINSKFKLATMRLFKLQENGALVECCDTLYEGVPYQDLNNAMKINIGLDIINTLSDFYNFNAPIFIDNAESVTKFIDVNSQIIKLIVSEQDKQIRKEVA